jgi:FlaG/FlaF family flagellin (archaellin)
MISRKRLFGSKRAFSPVIAALILMLLAVAAGVVVYSYVMGWLGGATQNPGGQKGELQFDSIHATASDDVIKIYIRNVGGKDVTISHVYVEGVAQKNGTDSTTDVNEAISVSAVKYLQVDTTGSVTLTAEYYYEVKVTCTDGTTVSQSVEAE